METNQLQFPNPISISSDENLEEIEIEITKDELELLQKAAESQGITVEQFLSNLLWEYAYNIENQGEELE